MCRPVINLPLGRQRFIDDHVFGNDFDDRLARIKACIRILENDLHFLTHPLHLAGIKLGNILAVIQDLPGGRLNQA